MISVGFFFFMNSSKMKHNFKKTGFRVKKCLSWLLVTNVVISDEALGHDFSTGKKRDERENNGRLFHQKALFLSG